MAEQTMEHAQPLTLLAEDEVLFRDSVREFAEGQIRPLVREMDEQAKIPRDAHRPAVRPRGHGDRDPGNVRRRRRELLPRRPGGRGAVAGRSVRRRPRGRAEHARRQRAAALGQRGHQAALPDEARVGHRRRVRALGSRVRQRRVRPDDEGPGGRRQLRAHGAQALDHQRQRGGRLPRLRDRSTPRPATAASRRSSSSAGSPGSPSARRKTSSASARAARAS